MSYAFTPPPPGQTLHLSYEKARTGRYCQIPASLGTLSYFADRGAKASTNEFWDPKLVFGTSDISNVLVAIQSARKNGFAALALTISPKVYSLIASDIGRLAAEEHLSLSIAFPPKEDSDYVLETKFIIP